ncbi:MAG: hypothetical protein JXJ22_00660 [Bacteroidales bacterium]|nr:hypothetical protein [Bacteroidales bacterium]
MKRDYICPFCYGNLQVCEYIVFSARNTNKKFGLVLLHPEIGNYSIKSHPDFSFHSGEHIDFYCPMCHKSLVSDIDENLIQLVLIEDEKEYKIYFSRIAGEKSTYKVHGDDVTSTGEHADRYTFFKLADKYKKYL